VTSKPTFKPFLTPASISTERLSRARRKRSRPCAPDAKRSIERLWTAMQAPMRMTPCS